MKKLFFLLIATAAATIISCGGNKGTETETTKTEGQSNHSGTSEGSQDVKEYDPNRGEGKFSAENVTVGALDKAMASKGEAIAGTKCTSCHKLTDEKLVGPGWKGVTERRTPHWIMNFITNPDPMIDKDPAVQAQLELCLVRMPNQNLADEEARSIVEYLRKNDGAK